MNPNLQTVSLAGTLEKQLHLLRELSGELMACRTAYVKMDLDAIYQHIASQSALCDQLRQVEGERQSAWRAACVGCGVDPSAGDLAALLTRLDPCSATRIREIVTELALAEGELRHLNRAQMVLVEGSRRTLGILANVLSSFAPMYARPAAPAEPATGARL